MKLLSRAPTNTDCFYCYHYASLVLKVFSLDQQDQHQLGTFLKIFLFIYFWLHWVFIAAWAFF